MKKFILFIFIPLFFLANPIFSQGKGHLVIIGGGEKTTEILSKLKVDFTLFSGYMYVDSSNGHLVVSSRYLKTGNKIDIGRFFPRQLNGTDPWACSDCDCTEKLEARIATWGKGFLKVLRMKV